MTNLDKNLSEIFDIDPIKGSIIIEETPVTEITTNSNLPAVLAVNEDDVQMEEDFKKLRQNTQDLLIKGQIALEHALDIVQQSDQPRAIEVFSTLLGQISKINQEALDLHQKRRDIKNAKSEADTPKTVNNNAIFVGSTAELNKIIAGMSKNVT